MANGDEKYVTVSVWDKKNAFMHKAMKDEMEVINGRVTKYADKADTLSNNINEIKISMAKMIAYQESDSKSNARILDLLTSNIKINEDDIKSNQKRINVFSGGAATLAFIFSYLWSVLKQ